MESSQPPTNEQELTQSPQTHRNLPKPSRLAMWLMPRSLQSQPTSIPSFPTRPTWKLKVKKADRKSIITRGKLECCSINSATRHSRTGDTVNVPIDAIETNHEPNPEPRRFQSCCYSNGDWEAVFDPQYVNFGLESQGDGMG
ncbi:hypothetical protein H4Q26_005972 [Puccinia striiformis f. sp. tritici PST-130]|nr:hypothetical protein H4Q26_005972 [Puccinia striiformis f. sp. tritici PST-130]